MDGNQLLVPILGILWLSLWLGSGIWAVADANDRGKPGCMVGCLVLFLSWPFGLIAWLVFRPENRL